MKSRMIKGFLLLPVVVLISGCPGDEGQEDGPYVEDPPRHAEEPPLQPKTHSFPLMRIDQPGVAAVAGQVTLTALTASETEVSIFLEGGPAGESLPVSITRDGCGIGASAAWPLGQIEIDPDGRGIHTETVPEPFGALREEDFYVQIRDAEGQPLACGPPATERERTPSGTPAGEQQGGDPLPPPEDREEMIDPD